MFGISSPFGVVAQRSRGAATLRISSGSAVLGIAALLMLADPGSVGAAQPAPGASVAAAAASPNYAESGNWLARPAHPQRKVDVFYLYPTSYFKTSPSQPVICAINNSAMVAGAERSFAQQATAFDPVANVYAPYYRQADAVTVLTSPLSTQNKIIGATPSHDATAAFTYYIEHENQGRPFILAGHSQGSNVLLFLLSGYLKRHPAVYHRMIAAYVIGYGVTRSYLAQNPQLRFAKNAGDTGVIASWNTEAPGLTIKNPVVNPGSIAINPITWTRTQQQASAAQSLGSLLPNAAGDLVKVNHYADARVDDARGTIVCSTCSVEQYAPGKPGGFPRGIFHTHDYAFYYYNLRKNASVRIRRFPGADKHTQS
jgi:Protein of unknown function (DUF3089)